MLRLGCALPGLVPGLLLLGLLALFGLLLPGRLVLFGLLLGIGDVLRLIDVAACVA